ncbi:putative germin-like protein 2-3 [Triticum dicoccoides]|uniref:putative germin-like protein 2-3 n=1 Tax=Triticum dicoccoides TaxID=85692 RepID=UPI00188F233A|nr:putative germin-like protein 2-3 [Triticum dicoccoides]
MVAIRVLLLAGALLAFACSHGGVTASDPSLLQDFCVADKTSQVQQPLILAISCKDANEVVAEDFFFSGLHLAGNTANKQGSVVTAVNVVQIGGLNTMGISLVRIDYAPNGLNPPHTHPRSTEILTVLEDCLHVGFVTSNPDNRHFTKVLAKEDVFVFPKGLVHYQFNNGNTHAVAIVARSSQNPGVITVANAVFGSEPAISDDVITKAFQVEKNTVDWIQAQF